MARLEIEQFPCLSDNYGVLIHDPASGRTAAIDAPDESAVEGALQKRGWKLTDIFVTHHHADHTQGVAGLKQRHDAHVTGPAAEADRIAGLDRTVSDGETFDFAGHAVHVISTPGHTSGQASYHVADAGVAFTGDTLFALGCGRLFEGTPATMWNSLVKLMALPDETAIYCGHEYTQSNARFALTIDTDNAALIARAAEIDALRAAGKPTLPTTMALEKATNPFLRAADPSIRARLGMETASDAEVFAEIRKRKDNF